MPARPEVSVRTSSASINILGSQHKNRQTGGKPTWPSRGLEGKWLSARRAVSGRKPAGTAWRPTAAAIHTREDADAALLHLAELEQELCRIDAGERKAVARVQAEAAARRDFPARARTRLEAALERFCRWQLTQRGDLTWVQDGKSLRLRAGRMGYRSSRAVALRSEASVVRGLTALRQGRRFLRVTTGVDKEALRAYLLAQVSTTGRGTRSLGRGRLQAELMRAGVRLVQRHYWFYELKRDGPGPGR